MWRTRFLLVLLMVLTATAANTPEAISLGSVELRLGMPRDAVLARFAPYYNLQKVGSDSWIVSPKNQSAREAIGSISFREGKLTAIYREWGPNDQLAGAPFARAIFGVIQQLSQEGKHVCSISVSQTQDPQSELRTAFLVCGGKTVKINLAITDNLEYGSVVEALE